MEKLFGLIGNPLSHSFSSRYFEEKFRNDGIKGCRYLNFPLNKIDQLITLIKDHSNLEGLNVTIPFKEEVVPYLETISSTAKEIGAVNTLKIGRRNNIVTIHGFNSDAFGFHKTLTLNNVNIPPKALILGSGGASKAVEWVLKKQGCDVWFVSRNPNASNQIGYELLKQISLDDFMLVINTTPLGMYPNLNSFPDIPYHTAGSKHTFIDLIYNPEVTVFMHKAIEQKAKAINGLIMLEQQAEKSWEIWHGGNDEINP